MTSIKGRGDPPLHTPMASDDKPRKVVGVYDRPARADRKWPRWLPAIIAVLVGLAWLAYLLLQR